MSKYINYLKKLIPEIIFMPVYWLSFLFPRKENLWVFGEWHGLRYSDNSKYLFEYVHREHKNIRVVWITKDKRLRRRLKKKGFTAHYAYWITGIYYCLRARLVITTHGARDVGHYFIGGATLINLTHGVPLKRLGKDSIYGRFGSMTNIIERYILLFLPLKNRPKYIVCADERSKVRFESAYLAEGRVFPVGYPRWDGLSMTELTSKYLNLLIKDFDKIVLYAPTLRFNNHVEYRPFELPGFNCFKNFLKTNNILFIFRPHPTMPFDDKHLKSDNIFIASSNKVEDINELFKISDILITDYSSVMYDYNILNKPIHYFVPDLDAYLNDDVGIYGDFINDALGPISKNWQQLSINLKKEKSNPSSHKIYPNDYFSHLVYMFIIEHIHLKYEG